MVGKILLQGAFVILGRLLSPCILSIRWENTRRYILPNMHHPAGCVLMEGREYKTIRNEGIQNKQHQNCQTSRLWKVMIHSLISGN